MEGTQAMTRHVTVFGATGAQGAPVVEEAVQAGLRVTAIARRVEAVAARHGPPVQAAAADFADTDSLVRVLDGADAAFVHLPIPTDPALPQIHLTNLLDAARQARLPLLVFTTSGPTGPRYAQTAMIAGNTAAAGAVLDGGVPAIVLQPTIYLENLLVPLFVSRLSEHGVLDYPPLRASQRVSWTSQRDQARIAAAALARPDLAGRAFEVATPGALTGPDLAEALAIWLGRPATFVHASPATFGARVAGALGNPGVGHALEGLYTAIGQLSDDGMAIDVSALQATFGVTLSPVADHLRHWPVPKAA